MNSNKYNGGEQRILEKTLNSLEDRRKAPLVLYALLLMLYLTASVFVSSTAGSQNVIMLGEHPMTAYMFAGIYSAIGNLCIILMVSFCGKLGFITALIALLIQTSALLSGIFVRGNYTSIPGIFTSAVTIVVLYIIFKKNLKLDRYQSKILEQATTDILTGLPNGTAGTELIRALVRRNVPFAVVSIDINGFKSINDTLGFEMGNRVLIEIASVWKNIAESGLSRTLDFITRVNGDEFSLIVREFRTYDDIVKTIKQYEEALGKKVHMDGYEFFINASFGYAIYPVDSDDSDSVFSHAVAAMKEIKRRGSGEHILRFSPELLRLQNQLVIDNKVRYAIEKDLVFFNLQPQYDMSHKLRGFEALARMRDIEGNILSPDEFIPAAERLGLIDEIDLAVYWKSARFFGELIRKTGADITLSINVSVKHLMKSGFIEEIKRLLKESGIPAGQLEVEITESIMIESPEKAVESLNKLKEMGLSIAIDDFGTGYSSLSYLNSFPSDILKIDKSFIDKMNENDSSKKYVKAIISLAHVLDFKVIAEGTEEPEQIETLKTIDCDYVQGFYWGRPLPEDKAEELVTGKAQ